MSGKQHFKLEGLVVAIVTPFQPCNLRVDEDSFVKYLQYLWDAGVRSIIVNGTTGEFTSMTMEERMHITELARAHWPGIMVNNVSAASYQDALALLEHSQQPIAGAEAKVDAALLLPPYYFSAAPEEGLERWLRHVLEEAHQPVFLYNFPAHTGNMIGPALYARLAHDFPLLRGIKNTFDDVPMAQQFKYAMPDRQVFIGSDKMALEAAEAGLDGNVSSGGGSAIVSAMLATVDAAVKGDDESAESAFASVTSWHDQREGMGVLDIPAAKVALASTIEGFSATVRPPLLPASREQQQQLQDAMHRLNNSKS
ncbi:aldolase [Coccomyxa subellipsoidea C-169]|uniref:4-hydroxy-tetrahydrodipicolinate synthase n=1 Tax=Coccomyxa subellipsoidea (strain C-169) TaxID=574566 RepID=I0Z2C8_COCSC|nr:aldolase [Coccomyxa subellipsoidea C-169]EIE24797.1 aldolase [Coccomyxa subellipsoidea C-169]|eukprot:XP_005649341.1 aldolase [Coccomyxa subellipsoidea C-169]